MNGGSLLFNQKESAQAMDMFSESEKALVMTKWEYSFEVLRKFGTIGPILKSIHFLSLGGTKWDTEEKFDIIQLSDKSDD